MFNKFVDNVNSDETNDLGWLDSWAMELEAKLSGFPRVSKVYSVTYVFSQHSHCRLVDCDIRGNAPLCPIREGLETIQTPRQNAKTSHWNDETELMVIPPTRLSRESIVGDWSKTIETESPIHDADSPDCNLRNELFARMLVSNCMVMPENFDRVMALECPLDFMDENVCFASDTTEVYNDNELLGKVGYHKLTERKFLSVRELSRIDMMKNKAYCESQDR